MEKANEARIVADRIEIWMHSDELQHVRLLFVSFFQPHECLLVVADSEVSVHHRASWNIARPASQF